MDWKESVRKNGFAHFRNLIPEPLVVAARKVIDCDLRDNYDASRQEEYDTRSYCPDIRHVPPIMDLIEKSPIREIIDEALGWDFLSCGGGQIAIRRARNAPGPAAPGPPHLDGFAFGSNGLRPGTIFNFAATVGVFLTETSRPFTGNLTVWPGSHHVYERYFRERGLRALHEGMPMPPGLGQPIQLMCGVGDVILLHYHLGHVVSVNTADADRYAVYFRLQWREFEAHKWYYLTHMWARWRI